MRAYIMIEALAILAVSAGIYAANTEIEQALPGYKWVEQRGEAANEADNGSARPYAVGRQGRAISRRPISRYP